MKNLIIFIAIIFLPSLAAVFFQLITGIMLAMSVLTLIAQCAWLLPAALIIANILEKQGIEI